MKAKTKHKSQTHLRLLKCLVKKCLFLNLKVWKDEKGEKALLEGLKVSTKIGLKSNKLCRKGRTVLIEKKRGGLVVEYK